MFLWFAVEVRWKCKVTLTWQVKPEATDFIVFFEIKPAQPVPSTFLKHNFCLYIYIKKEIPSTDYTLFGVYSSRIHPTSPVFPEGTVRFKARQRKGAVALVCAWAFSV